ncbi:MAG: tryptophan synthase alpha chain [Glaciecola sp.]|jgi:tryptophan synthase alpha chain
MRGSLTGKQELEGAFAKCREQGRAALIIYLPAGYPDLETSEQCLRAAAEAGADILEVGFPFSDPMMDGPTIQSANQVALDQGLGVVDDIALSARLTASIDVPAVTMTYFTIPDARGVEWFADSLLESGLAGAILPDLPVEEAEAWLRVADARGLATIFLASSISTDDRLALLAKASSGWVYATGLLGVTGVKNVAGDVTRNLVERLRKHTDLPIAVGLGVKTPAHAAEVARYADGVIVGSATIQAIMDGPLDGAPEKVAAFVRSLRAGIDAA